MNTQPLRVLVADDEPLIAADLVALLQFNDIEAMGVRSGIEAVALASTFRPAIALLDMQLTDISGLQAADAIRLVLPECRIVLTSGLPPLYAMLGEAAAGGLCFELLAKPVQAPALMSVLQQIAPV